MDVMLAAFARGSVNGLASLPHVLLKLLEVYDGGAAGSEQLGRIIAIDPALSAKVLALACAESPDPGAHYFTLQRAVDSLGVEAVKSIAVGASGHHILLRYGADWRDHLHKLWLRALTCALAARALAEMVEYPVPEEAWLGGLLHNIGQLALGAYAPEQYPNLLAVAQEGPKLEQLELSHFDIQHYEVGAMLIESWNLQSFLADAVRYQAEPPDKLHDAHPLVRIVCVARALSMAPATERDAALGTADAIFPQLHPSRLRALIDKAEEQATETARRLRIPLDPDVADADMADKAFELANRIRSIAVLDGVSQPLSIAHEMTTLARAARCGVEILVGENACRLLVYDSAQDVLIDACEPDRTQAVALRLAVESGDNLPARALKDNRILNSADAETAEGLVVVDRQLLRQLGTQAMLCVPLVDEGAKAGVILVGFDKRSLPYPRDRLVLLQQFASRAAAAVVSGHTPAARAFPAPAEMFEQHVRQSIHEARNPLTTVKNYVQILSRRHSGEQWAERDLKIISEEIERIDSILDRLADMSRGQRGEPGAAGVNRIVTDMIWLLQTSTLDARNIKVKLNLADSIPPLAVDVDGLKQVVGNLVNNAADAMPNGGEITVSTRAGINVNGRMHGELSVRDGGHGVDPEMMDRLFRQGTTAKGAGRGLGLSIVAQLVAGWGGSIRCRSAPGEGTVFDVLLPYREAPGE
ncbi:MAG TPA: HDOD domain-containing protein [Gammaproteobacteria bacterium]|nr:HDOD domain-containing protein [Gammaproteobacteria bacterium]